MFPKLLYAKIGILDWCRCHMKNIIPSSINKKIDYIFEIYNGSPLITFH